MLYMIVAEEWGKMRYEPQQTNQNAKCIFGERKWIIFMHLVRWQPTFILTLKEPTQDCSTTQYQDGDGDQWHEKRGCLWEVSLFTQNEIIYKTRSTFQRIYMYLTQNTDE